MVKVLVGMIAAGKSTYARNAAAKGFVILNDDALVTALHGGDYSLYSKDLKPLYKSTENHILTTALALGRSVVVDRGLNCSAVSRARWIALARSLDVPVEAVVFKNEGPVVHAGRRAKADGRGYAFSYWHRVAAHHDSLWQEPVLSEGFAAVDYLSWPYIQSGGL